MAFSSNTYTFYSMIIQQCPGLTLKGIKDLRRDLHPKPSPLIRPNKIVNRKSLKTRPSHLNFQALPIYKPMPQRTRRPSFLLEDPLNNFK